MKDILPFLGFVVLLIAMLAFLNRARRRQAQQATAQAEQLTVGTEVMTTSGLYGTVVSRNDDDTVQLAVAPGVEVKWALAALRDVRSLPDRYRKAHRDDEGDETAPRL